jgi:hypothetical protein
VSAGDPEPRRTGAFWKTYRALYWSLTIGLGVSVSLSVTWYSIRAAGGAGVLPAQATPGAVDCDAQLAKLYTEVREEGGRLMTAPTPHMADTWHDWSEGWRERYKTMRAQCTGTGAPDRKAIRLRAKDLERVHLAYTTAFRGLTEIGHQPIQRIQARPGGAP